MNVSFRVNLPSDSLSARASFLFVILNEVKNLLASIRLGCTARGLLETFQPGALEVLAGVDVAKRVPPKA